jgi:hypothetical protein
MQQNDDSEKTRSWLNNVLTDVHFWVPVGVLIAGLVLLKAIH